ncbi:hypothetical protein LJR045_002181 [Microbacterium sp. LjRoot45]|uniref:hypothetical protein n=1 Tax=Microbacterium sp. LjRoot45 TaxID=3342329 RepID=UPI003ECD1E2A
MQRNPYALVLWTATIACAVILVFIWIALSRDSFDASEYSVDVPGLSRAALYVFAAGVVTGTGACVLSGVAWLGRQR